MFNLIFRIYTFENIQTIAFREKTKGRRREEKEKWVRKMKI